MAPVQTKYWRAMAINTSMTMGKISQEIAIDMSSEQSKKPAEARLLSQAFMRCYAFPLVEPNPTKPIIAEVSSGSAAGRGITVTTTSPTVTELAALPSASEYKA